MDDLNCIHQAGAHSLETVFGLPAIEAESEVTDDPITSEFLDRIAKFRFVGPGVVPNMKLQQIDVVDPEFFPDQISVFQHMVGRKNILILVLSPRRPLAIHWRNLGSRIQTLAWVGSRSIPGQDLAEQAIALALAVGPGGAEEVAAQIGSQLQRVQRLAVVGTAPSAHSPESVGHFADFKTGAAEFPVFHDSPQAI